MTPAEKREIKRRRADYLVGGPCAVSGQVPHDVHEILAGANRQAAWKEPACWLRVTREAHGTIQGIEVEAQLAFKLLNDPLNFDLDAFCRAWNRPRTAADDSKILNHVRNILMVKHLCQ